MFDRILLLQHKGGEYLSINISSIKDDRSEIWTTLHRAEQIMKKPSATSNIALQILDSKLSKSEINEITKWLKKLNSEIQRLAIIGAKNSEKRSINKYVKLANLQINSKNIFDWDTAKDWLVGKRLQ